MRGSAEPAVPSPKWVFAGIEELRAATGEPLGASDWLVVSQDLIDRFAEATGDMNWIHVDSERAARGPRGATIAHGFLSLSVIPTLIKQVYDVQGVAQSLNYGCNRVRFPAPVPAGSRVRAAVTVAAVEVRSDHAVLALDVTLEIEGQDKPACVVQYLRHLGLAASGAIPAAGAETGADRRTR